MTASVTASTGGVSIMIQSNGPFDRFVSSIFMRSDERSSDGFGGVCPAVTASRFGSTVRWITSRTRARPFRICARPRSFVSLSSRCRLGRRMSPSMSRTREPPYASTSAMLHAVVVLPSSGCALVTTIVFVASPG